MLTGTCACGAPLNLPSSALGDLTRCHACGRRLLPLSGLPPTDADLPLTARLVVTASPHGPGTEILLAGDAPIHIGKSDSATLRLDATRVSRKHCTLTPPSNSSTAWTLTDHNSTNGTFVNGHRVHSHTLSPGDRLTLGEYELVYRTAPDPADADLLLEPILEPLEPPTPSAPPTPPGPKQRLCPSCRQPAAPDAKICIPCGIDLKTGQSVLTSRGFDDEDRDRARRLVNIISIFSPITFVPVPVASEAFGTRRPRVIRAVALITTVISVLFFLAVQSQAGWSTFRNLMLWAGDPRADSQLVAHFDKQIEDMAQEAYAQYRQQTADPARSDARPSPPGHSPPPPPEPAARPKTLDDFRTNARAEVRDQIRAELREQALEHPPGSFMPHQLLTSAFLHDFGGIFGFVIHLGGNLLFLFIFGNAVNALLGDLKTALVYPALAIAAGLVHYIAEADGPLIPMVGASGAIMGLAGMYFVFFPVHRLHTALWFRPLFFLPPLYTIRRIPGYIIVLWYIAFDLIATLTSARDGTAHWAHLGGFLAGVLLALLLMITRLADARGADLLSRFIGPSAWLLLGKPSSRPSTATV